MKRIALLTIIILAATCTAVISSPLQQETETKSFAVTKGGNLALDTSGGSVSVSFWDKSEIRVTVDRIDKEDVKNL